MGKVKIIDTSGKLLNMDVEFAFHCQENDQNYIAINNHDDIFESLSKYANLDLFKITQIQSNKLIVSDIEDAEWPVVRKCLQFEIFSKK